MKAEDIRFEKARGRHVLVALSGGSDSVALLCLLSSCSDIRLTAAHFNHRIRGVDADGDEAFCRALCGRLDIPIITGSEDIPALAAERGQGLETCARDERHRFLAKAADSCGADLIALAHHADDQAETVLMHLFRGTGPEGISGMRELSGRLYRPLLGVRKSELEAYLTKIGMTWRCDATNDVADNPRNALRLNILPEIEKLYPGAVNAIVRYTELAGKENDYIEMRLRKISVLRTRYFDRIELSESPDEVLLRRILRRLCGPDLDSRKTEELITLTGHKSGRLQVFGDLTAEKTGGRLYLIHTVMPLPDSRSFDGEGRYPMGAFTLIAETLDENVAFAPENGEIVDADALKGSIIRFRQSGDVICPLGRGKVKPLADHLSDRKTDRPLRDLLPLIAVGNRILYAGDAGISEEVRVTGSTKRRIRISIEYTEVIP